MRRREKALGLSHIDTLLTTNDLAQLLCTLEQYTDAKEMYIRVLVGYETTMGHDHVDTLKVAMNLAAVMYKLGEQPSFTLDHVVLPLYMNPHESGRGVNNN